MTIQLHAFAGDLSWVRVSSDGQFLHRDSGRYFHWRGQPWISNGYAYGGEARRDLITSANGSDWITVNASTEYPPYSPIGVHNNQIVIVGPDKVRTTNDGLNFKIILDSSPVITNYFESPFITNFLAAGETTAKMYLILSEKIYYSTDGTNWEWTNTPWDNTYLNYVGIEYKGKVYILGGDITPVNLGPVKEAGYPHKISVNHVWASDKPEDVSSWTKTTAPWEPRMWPAIAIHKGMLWMTGGFSNINNLNFNDTHIFDGSEWTKLDTSPTFTSRHAAASFSHNGSLFIVGGNRNPDARETLSDVWTLRDLRPLKNTP